MYLALTGRPTLVRNTTTTGLFTADNLTLMTGHRWVNAGHAAARFEQEDEDPDTLAVM
jgi:hypothetical protein